MVHESKSNKNLQSWNENRKAWSQAEKEAEKWVRKRRRGPCGEVLRRTRFVLECRYLSRAQFLLFFLLPPSSFLLPPHPLVLTEQGIRSTTIHYTATNEDVFVGCWVAREQRFVWVVNCFSTFRGSHLHPARHCPPSFLYFLTITDFSFLSLFFSYSPLQPVEVADADIPKLKTCGLIINSSSEHESQAKATFSCLLWLKYSSNLSRPILFSLSFFSFLLFGVQLHYLDVHYSSPPRPNITPTIINSLT